ncbi:MAG: LPS export ABC transporter permease LptG [Desulfobacterales bacterium]|nr:LPS export ABC transporter permease LptG [Desulfobacterales bacterium]
MTVIHRYITASFVKYFCFVLILVVAIYLSVDFIGRIDNFLESGRSAEAVALYFMLKIPLIISQITPLGVLLSVLIIFGLMNKNNEVIALKSGGVSVFYLIVPVVAAGVILSGLLFVFSEVVVPISAAEAARIEEDRRGGADAVSSAQKNIWIRHDEYIVHVKYYHPADRALTGVSIYAFDGDFNLVRRIDAASAAYQDKAWVLFDCTEQRFSPESGQQADAGEAVRVVHHKQKAMALDLKPSDFKQVARDAQEMSFTALWNYIAKTRAEGYDTTKYEVDLYAKTAFPMVCLIMSLMGAGIALRGKTRDGLAVSFAYGMITAFVYWTVYSFCLSLGYGGVLPPWLAAWSANVLFFLAAGVLLLSLE